jgi:hypothetical protein
MRDERGNDEQGILNEFGSLGGLRLLVHAMDYSFAPHPIGWGEGDKLTAAVGYKYAGPTGLKSGTA